VRVTVNYVVTVSLVVTVFPLVTVFCWSTVPPPLEFHHSDFHGNLRDTVTLAGYRIFPGNAQVGLTIVGPLGMIASSMYMYQKSWPCVEV